GVAKASARGTDIRVTVVAVDAPGLQDALDVALIAGSTDVVNHLVAAVFLHRLGDPRSDHIDRFLPINALPNAIAALPDALHRVEGAGRGGGLVGGRRPFGAQAAATCRMQRVAFELADLVRVPVHVSQKATGGLAVETGRGDQAVVMFFSLARPMVRVDLDDIVPSLRPWMTGKARA